jgi:hypothetical protein
MAGPLDLRPPRSGVSHPLRRYEAVRCKALVSRISRKTGRAGACASPAGRPRDFRVRTMDKGWRCRHWSAPRVKQPVHSVRPLVQGPNHPCIPLVRHPGQAGELDLGQSLWRADHPHLQPLLLGEPARDTENRVEEAPWTFIPAWSRAGALLRPGRHPRACRPFRRHHERSGPQHAGAGATPVGPGPKPEPHWR